MRVGTRVKTVISQTVTATLVTPVTLTFYDYLLGAEIRF